MNRKWGLIIGVFAFFLFITAKIEASAQVVIIVNAQNPISKITVLELRSIYYGQKNFWADNSKIVAVDLAEDLPERKDFSLKVFNLSPAVVERKYVKLAFSGTGHPPAQIMPRKKCCLLSLITVRRLVILMRLCWCKSRSYRLKSKLFQSNSWHEIEREYDI